MSASLLEVRDLRVRFDTELGAANVVDGVSFGLAPGETLGLVGESGCGKSVTARSILRLVEPAGTIVGGDILWEGRSVLAFSPRELRAWRGRHVGFVFQDPVASINPVLTCGDQIAEVVRAHAGVSRAAARARAVELLRRVRLPDPERQSRAYAHEMSGGMCQRVALALALAGEPRLLIADEPTTALDVSVQAQLCELLHELQVERQLALLLISHDLGLVAGLADRVAILYAGRVVESADVRGLFADPRHPYTRGLLAAMPRIDVATARFEAIPGVVPHPARIPDYCRFEPRCAHAVDACRREDPALRAHGEQHAVACVLDLPPWRPNGGDA